MNIQENQLNTPFIRKLNHILTDSTYSQIITWDSTGTMIDILDEKKIQTEILPKFFRHSKFQSFIRQLNLYGFKKIKKNDSHRFRHPDLMKGTSLFSIKSQRKFKNLLQKRKYIDKQSIQEEMNSNMENEIKQSSEKKNNQESQKNEKIETQNYGELNPMNLYSNPLSYQALNQSLLNLSQINMCQQLYYSSLLNNGINFGLQRRYFPNSNQIFYYN